VRRLRWVALGVVLLALVGAWLGYRGLAAKRHLDQARAGLTTARSDLLDGRLDAAAAGITAAGRETAQARRLTGDPVWRVISLVPLLGNNVRSGRGVAVAADDAARSVLPEALTAARLLQPSRLRRPGGAVDVALLRTAEPSLTRSAHRADRVDRAVSDLPTRLLARPVRTAVRQATEQFAQLAEALDAAATSVQVAPALLGADRPRRYFVLLQQTAESRGTGGIPGGYAVVSARAGKLTVESSGSNAELRGGTIPVPAGVSRAFADRYEPLGSFELWPNVTMSPDLPNVARLVAARWKAQGGGSVDGVVAMDAIALKDLLRGSGPIDVGGQSIPPAGIEAYLSVGQYVGVVEGGLNDERKERLSQIAGTAVGRLVAGAGDPQQAVRGVVDAVRSGHLRMASDDPALAPVLHRTHVDGALPEGPAPVAYPVVFSTTGGKLDTFLDRTVQYRAGSCSGRTRRSTITLTLRSTPPAGLPPYVTIRERDGVHGSSLTSSLGVQVYGTRGSRLLSVELDGRPFPVGGVLEPGTEAGLPVWLTYLDLPPGKARVLELQLVEPTAAGAPRVPEQPLARPLLRHLHVTECHG
jgi:hypothetical protein